MEKLDFTSVLFGIVIGLCVSSLFYSWEISKFVNGEHTYLVSKKDGIVDIKQTYKTRGECLVVFEDKLKNGPIQDQIQCVTIKGNVL